MRVAVPDAAIKILTNYENRSQGRMSRSYVPTLVWAHVTTYRTKQDRLPCEGASKSDQQFSSYKQFSLTVEDQSQTLRKCNQCVAP